MITELPRPEARIVGPSASGSRSWAVGYVSAGPHVRPGGWTAWHGAIEAHVLRQGLPLLHIYCDDRSTGTTRFAAVLAAIRKRAHLRSGHVGVVVVPALAHLNLAGEGSEDAVSSLLRLHFDVTVQVAGSPPIVAQPRQRNGTPAAAEEFTNLLLGINGPTRRAVTGGTTR